MRPHTLLHLIAALAAAIGASAGPAAAQYDRDGRYVPSPMGVPTDPAARPIPLYPGTPGQAVGTPIWPREPAPKMAPMTPRVNDPPLSSSLPRRVQLQADDCRKSWSRATGLTPVEFRRRCHLLLRREH